MEPKVNEYDMLVSLYGQERVDRQIELEIEGQQLGRESYLKNIERKRLANEGANAGAAKGFVQTALPMMVAGLNEWFESVNNGKPGKRHRAASVIKDVDVDTTNDTEASLKRRRARYSDTPAGSLGISI